MLVYIFYISLPTIMEFIMATKQTDGTSDVTSASTVNNGGTMIAHGSSTALESTSPAPEKVGVFGSTVIDGTDTDKALSAGTFSFNNQDPLTKRVTTSLAGVANTALKTTGSVPGNVRSIHKLETLRTRRLTAAIRANAWNQYAGTWEAGYPVVDTDTLESDVAANPSRSIPGKLNFMFGNPVPEGTNYKAKTN